MSDSGDTYLAPPAPVRRTGRTLAALGSVAVLVVGIAFAVTQLGSSDGASSPEAAVSQLVKALEAGDALGVLDVLPPGERESIRQPLVDLTTELRRLGILGAQLDLGKVPGITIKFDGLKTRTDTIRPDLAVVEFTEGRVSAKGRTSQLPLGPLLDELAFNGKRPDNPFESTHNLASGDPVRLATVKQGGGWHVSLWYTVAEELRTKAGKPVPAAADAIGAVGASTPDGAMKEMVTAALNLDARRAIELTPPDEARVLHEYAPLFLPDAESAAKDLKQRDQLSLSLDQFESSVTGTGATRSVTVTKFKVSGSTTAGKFSVTFDGACATIDAPDATGSTSKKVCKQDIDKAIAQSGLGALQSALEGIAPQVGVVVVQVDGLWYVSPTRTVTELVLGILRPLTQQKVRDAVNAIKKQSEAQQASSDKLDQCYSADDPAGCFKSAIADGSLQATDVPPEYRFADCYGDYTNQRTDLSAAELRVAAGKVHDCLSPHVLKGEISWPDVDPEVAKPSCISAVNPYGSADGSASAFDDLAQCAAGSSA